MLGIIVCEDDRFMLDMFVQILRSVTHNTLDIVCASCDFTEVLLFIEKNPGAYLYFLDIDFGRSNLNGVDIARVIKKKEPLSKIVFVSGHAHMGMDILKSGVEAFGFIEKSTDKNIMIQGYKKYINLACKAAQKQTEEPTVKLLTGIDEYVYLPISQILYVETDKSVSHFVRYHTIDGSDIAVRDTIENVLKTLGRNFMKSHRSVIINKNCVVSVSDGLVTFASGEQAACSFRLKNEVMRQCGVGKK